MNLDWYPVDRQELAAVLLGAEKPINARHADPYSANTRDVVVGMRSPLGAHEASVPAIILVGSSRREVFSWVSTYAEEVFPLSQFCRVLGAEDWSADVLGGSHLVTVGAVNPVWPSLVLGEMLGQVGADPDVATMPLSRASACFSFGIARTVLLYPRQEKLRTTCAERLALAEREPRFGRRNITTESLRKVWSAALALERVPMFGAGSEFVRGFLEVLGALNRTAHRHVQSSNGLLSDSAEERVGGFDVVVDSFSGTQAKESVERDSRAIALAAAALLAGRGTSHIQLLATVSRDLPEVFVWYGLLAGVVGPRFWDKAWMQQAKGVERALRQFFRADEPVQADICWAEYEWLAQTYDSVEMLLRLPRSFPSGLAIEIVPGVVCQFRLGEHGPGVRASAESRAGSSEPVSYRASVSAAAVSKAIELLTEAKQLLEGAKSKDVRQPGLFGAEEPPRPQKARRNKSVSTQGRRSEN